MKGRITQKLVATVVCLGTLVGAYGCGKHKGPVNNSNVHKNAGNRALNEGNSCRAVDDFGQPLIVDWKTHQRANLEEAMIDGVTVVHYDCKSLRLLKGCHVKGNAAYSYVGLSRKEDVIHLDDGDEVRANLPGFGGKLAMNLDSEFKNHQSLNVALIMVGKKRTPKRHIEKTELVPDQKGDCEGATHFVRGAFVGAFAMNTGQKSQWSTAASIFGAGAGAGSHGASSNERKDGNPDSCAKAKQADDSPPDSCQALLRLELVALDSPKEEKGEEDEEVIGCPKGMVFASGKCVPKRKAVAGKGLTHLCKRNDFKDCREQCKRNSAGSCHRMAHSLRTGSGGAKRSIPAAALAYAKGCDLGYGDSCSEIGYFYYKGIGLPKNATKARKYFKMACDKSSALGCSNLGLMASNGQGGPKDERLAGLAYKIACRGGKASSCNDLGYMYERGLGGLRRDKAKAAELYDRACTGGNKIACTNAGIAYRTGMGGQPKDPAKARYRFRKACNARNGKGCYFLAEMYQRGEGGRSSSSSARTYYRKGCSYGYRLACKNKSSSSSAASRRKRDQTKFRNAKRDCSPSNDKACYDLGYAYRYGRGTGKNKSKALRQFKDLCQKRYYRACTALASMYKYGEGVRKNPKMAAGILSDACNKGKDRNACFEGALLYKYGSKGFTKNIAMAVKYYEKACRLGSSYSCESAAKALLRGKGVRKDRKRALELYSKACKLHGNRSSYRACRKARSLRHSSTYF